MFNNLSHDQKKAFGKVAALFSSFFVVYNVVLFVIAGFSDHTGSFWLSYVFMILAWAVTSAITCINFSKGFTLKDFVFGFPILKWSIVYIISELVMSTVFMIIPVSWIKAAFILQFLMLFVFLLISATCFIGKKVAVSDEKVKEKVFYIRNIHSELESVFDKVTDDATKKALLKLIEAVKYSDPMSHESLAVVEQEIEIKVSALRMSVCEGNYESALTVIKAITDLLNDRNRNCKILK